MNIQHVDHDLVSTIRLSNSLGSGKQQQSMKNVDARSNIEDLALVPIDKQKAGAVPNAASPTLKISNPDLAKMVKDAQAAMFINTTPKIHAPLVTLNTTVHDIPSQSMESFGERDGDSGQQLLSTENNQ